MQLTTELFWQFAVAHYQRPGVERACLTLQNQYQGNINLALLLICLDTHIDIDTPASLGACSLDSCGIDTEDLERHRTNNRCDNNRITLSHIQLQTLVASLEPSQALLQPYRHLRNQLKPQLDSTGYRQLLNFELALERHQQQDLLQQLATFNLESHDSVTQPSNLHNYCLQLGAQPLLEKLYGE